MELGNFSNPIELDNGSIVLSENGTLHFEDTDGTIFQNYPDGLLEFAAAACIIFMLVGVPGNLITVVALLRSPRLRSNATTVFIVHLCLADGFFCISSLPFAASTFIERRWVHGHTLCVLFPMFRYSNVAVSLLTVAAITINRYVLICHPKKYHVIYKSWTVALMILLLWAIAMALMLPPLLEIWGKFGFDPTVGTCTILKHNGSPKTMIYILAIAIPGTVFLICYTRIFIVVRRSKQAVRSRTGKGDDVKKGRTGKGDDVKKGRVQIHEAKSSSTSKDLRLLKIILVIFCTFLVCFLPVSVVKAFRKEEAVPVLNVLGYLGVFVTACTNPLIYVLMSVEYRQAYKQLFTCKK